MKVFTADGDFTFVNHTTVILAKSIPAATRVYLPANPSVGDEFMVKDGNGDAFTHNITIDGNTHNVDGDPDLVLNTDGACAGLLYDGAEWRRIGA